MPARFLIDVNLPRDFAFWNGPEFVRQTDITPVRTDRETHCVVQVFHDCIEAAR